MNAIYSLFSSLANLGRAVNRLAAALDVVSTETERRVELIGHTPAAPVTLEATETNGHGPDDLALAGAGTTSQRKRATR